MTYSSHTGTGTTGAYRQSWQRVSLRDVLARIVAAHPNYDEAEVEAEFWNQISAGWVFRGGPGTDQELMHAAVSYWVTNNYQSLMRHMYQPAPDEDEPDDIEPDDIEPDEDEPEAEPQAASHGFRRGDQTTSEPEQEAQAEPTEKQQRQQEWQEEREQERQQERQREAETRETRRSALRAAFEAHMHTKILDFIMPTGKALRDTTREELDGTIAWQARIRDLLQPGQTPGEAGLTDNAVIELI